MVTPDPVMYSYALSDLKSTEVRNSLLDINILLLDTRGNCHGGKAKNISAQESHFFVMQISMYSYEKNND